MTRPAPKPRSVGDLLREMGLREQLVTPPTLVEATPKPVTDAPPPHPRHREPGDDLP